MIGPVGPMTQRLYRLTNCRLANGHLRRMIYHALTCARAVQHTGMHKLKTVCTGAC